MCSLTLFLKIVTFTQFLLRIENSPALGLESFGHCVAPKFIPWGPFVTLLLPFHALRCPFLPHRFLQLLGFCPDSFFSQGRYYISVRLDLSCDSFHLRRLLLCYLTAFSKPWSTSVTFMTNLVGVPLRPLRVLGSGSGRAERAGSRLRGPAFRSRLLHSSTCCGT